MVGILKDKAVFANFLAGSLNRKATTLKHMQAVWLAYSCKSLNSWHGDNLLLCIAVLWMGVRGIRVCDSFQGSFILLYIIKFLD